MSSGLSQAQHAAVFEAAPVAMLVIDRDLVMRHANHAYLVATDKTLEEIVGRSVFDVFPNSPMRDDFDQATSLEGIMTRAVQTGEVQTITGYRYDIPVSDGTFNVRYWNFSETPVFAADGSVDVVLHYTEDITELTREREAREAAAKENEQLQARVASAQADLRRRADELEVLNERLRRSSEHDRSVAEALQQAMLTELPGVEPLQLTSSYRAAAAADRVGGDWYDAIRLPEGGGTTVMIGDVSGHDIGAAALMGQLRSMLRAFAWATGEPPSAIMAQLDRAMRDLQIRTFASAVLAHFDQPAGAAETGAYRMRWTNAGHPAPILIGRDGETTVLAPDPPTVMLGVRPETDRPDDTVTIPPGASVLFYTDGLVETRDADLLDRIGELRDSLSRNHALEPEARVERVIDEMVGAQPDDDVAVLLVELVPVSAQIERPVPAVR